MSTSRMVNTRFWDDDYASNLDPIEKLLFLYFLTNTSTNICGIYEVPLKKVAVDTGIDKEMVIKIIDRFTKDNKVYYHNGWLCMKNFIKNQNQKSPQVMIGIKNELDKVPKEIMDVLIGYGYPPISNLIKSNLIKSKETNEQKIKTATAYLSSIPSEDSKEFVSKYEVSERQVKSKAEDLLNYCKSKSKFYTDYKAFLSNALKKDFGPRVPKKEISPQKEEKLTPEQERIKQEGLAMVRQSMKL